MAVPDQFMHCPTCNAMMPHRPTPPDGWMRCRRCAPDAPTPVVVVNQYRGRSLFWHWIFPILVVGAISLAYQCR